MTRCFSRKIKKKKKLQCLIKINAILEIFQSCHKDHKTNQQCVLSVVFLNYDVLLFSLNSIETKILPLAQIKRNKLQSFKKNNSNLPTKIFDCFLRILRTTQLQPETKQVYPVRVDLTSWEQSLVIFWVKELQGKRKCFGHDLL